MVYANAIVNRGEAFADFAAAAARGLIGAGPPARRVRRASGRVRRARPGTVGAHRAQHPGRPPRGDRADARGFIYTVLADRHHGERNQLPPELGDTVARVKAATTVPVAVGFGISTGEQASMWRTSRTESCRQPDRAGGGERGPDAVREVVAELADAIA